MTLGSVPRLLRLAAAAVALLLLSYAQSSMATLFAQAAAPTATQEATAQAAAPAPQAPASSKTWLDKRAEIEEFIKNAKIVKCQEIPVGVTKPARCQLEPGGLVAEIAWKPIAPGRYGGFWESYKNEIAAYEIDKLLDLQMIPPTVEKRYNGNLGAAIMWLQNVQSFAQKGGAPNPPPIQVAHWNKQVVRAKMFDDLIGNIDPNLGNWLIDPTWNLMLIDHTRAFVSEEKLTHELKRFDKDLWTKMQALNEDGLKQSVGEWLGGKEIQKVIARRNKMQKIADDLVKSSNEDAVFLK